MDDEELRDLLKDLDDNEDITVTPWEAEFIENVVYAFPTGDLSEKQRDIAERIIQNYEV